MTGSERFHTAEPKKEGEIVVEVGAGSWPLPFQLTQESGDRLLSRTSRYIIVDVNEKALRENTARRDKTGIYNFLVARADRLPLANSSVNRIIMTNFLGIPPSKKLSHDYYHEHLLEEYHRVLADGGEIIIVEIYTPEYAREWLSQHKAKINALFEHSGESRIDSVFEFQVRRPTYLGTDADPFVLVLKRKAAVSPREP